MQSEQNSGPSNISSYRPSPTALKAAVRAVLPAIKERAVTTERARRVEDQRYRHEPATGEISR